MGSFGHYRTLAAGSFRFARRTNIRAGAEISRTMMLNTMTVRRAVIDPGDD
jgi:hypothetical protein